MSRKQPRYKRNNGNLPAAVPNLFGITVNGQIDLQNTINTFYYRDDGSLSTYANQAAVATAFLTSVAPTLYSFTSVDWALLSVRVENITSPGLVPYELAPTTAFNGGGPAGHEPAFVSVCIARITQVRSACGRGRVYLPGVPTSYVSGNQIINPGTGATALQNIATQIQSGFTVSGKTLVPQLFSKGSEKHPLAGAADIANTSIDYLLATTRRRKLLRGK